MKNVFPELEKEPKWTEFEKLYIDFIKLKVRVWTIRPTTMRDELKAFLKAKNFHNSAFSEFEKKISSQIYTSTVDLMDELPSPSVLPIPNEVQEEQKIEPI